MQLEQVRAQGRLNQLEAEVRLKKELMQFEFELNQKLREQERGQAMRLEQVKQDGKVKQEQVKKFESSGNDILGSGVGLDKFNPQVGN